MTVLPPGTPTWVNLSTTDIADAIAFYTALFGWTAETTPISEGGHAIFELRGKPVAGAGLLPGEPEVPAGLPPHWWTYIATDDARAAAARILAAGGTVLTAPFEVMDQGWLGRFQDPGGAHFAVWQSISMPGAEIFHAPGALTWNELATPDPEGAKVFYQSVFDWQSGQIRKGRIDYTVWRLAGQKVGGMLPMVSDLMPATVPPHWMVYFAVEGADATAARAAELGGALVAPIGDIPQGRIAVLNDRQGGTFAVIARRQV